MAAAGTVDASWRLFAGGAGAAGSSAVPVKAAGNRLGVAAYICSVGLGSSAQTQLIVSEFDAAGALLRATTVAALTGTQAAWPAANAPNLAGTVVTGAGCAWVDVQLRLVDAVAGASANGTVWFDNVQVWNATTTGQATMPYCETRFPQAPATVLLTGLLGDVPAPAALALGTYLAAGTWGPGATLRLVLGRRGQSIGVLSPPTGPASGAGGSGGQLVGGPVAFTGAYFGTGANTQAQSVLDATAYGGYIAQLTLDSGGWNPRALSPRASDLPGIYHLYQRFRSSQALGSLANVQVRPLVGQVRSPWYGLLDGSDVVGQYFGPYTQPLVANSTSNLWTVVDVGQIALPPFPAGALADPTQTFVVPRANWYDSTGGGATAQSGWQAFVPVDGSLLVGLVNFAANAGAQIGPVNSWLWVYGDGLLANRAGAGDMVASWTYSIEAAALPNAGRSAGGPGMQATGSINVNVGADPYLVLDPTLTVAGGATFGGINQIVSVLADGAGSVAALDVEVAYSPLYIYPS